MGENSSENERYTEASGVIDEIYQLLEGIDVDLRELQSVPISKIDVNYSSHIRDAVDFLVSWEYGGRLGISNVDLDKFQRMSGRVSTTLVRRVGERSKTLLKEVEGEIASKKGGYLLAEVSSDREEVAGIDYQSRVTPVTGWVLMRRSANADLIAQITVLLDDAIRLTRNTNLPPEKLALSQLERQQLIHLLETTLVMVRDAPLVEKSLLSKMGTAAKAGAQKAIEKKTETALGYALAKLAEAVWKLFGSV